jgi:tripartite ATP-independent transporter DctM subunit
MTLTLFVGSLLGAMAIGMPIAFALLFTGVVLMLYLGNFDSIIIAQNLINGADSFSLLAVPFFILAGELMNAGGISKRIINLSMSTVGHIKGGLGYVAIVGSVLFATLSGSAVADTAALGAILIPMMIAAGYDRNQSTALIAAGGVIGPVIPPSIPMILFGVTGGVSITKLFLAGIVPGIMLGLGLALTWFFMMRKKTVQTMPRQTFKQFLIALKDAFWALLIPAVILIGLRGGVFTPTEAAVVAAFISFVVGFVIYRELKISELYKVFFSSARMTSIIMFLTAAAMVVGWLITVANIPALVIDLVEPLMDNPTLLLLMINLLVIIIGTAMDLTPTILILTPVLMPVVVQAGIDPVYFGLLFVLNNIIGLITPPVGTVLNVAAAVGKTRMEDLTKAILPFFLVEVFVLLLLILFPGLVLVPLEWFHK